MSWNIDLEKVQEWVWNINTSMIFTEIESDTIQKRIKWYNEKDNLVKYEIANYYAVYKTDDGKHFSLVLSNDEFEGWFLRITEYKNGKAIITKELDEWYYGKEMKDLLVAVEHQLGLKNRPFTITETCPWYPKAKEKGQPKTTWSEGKKVLTARGRKAEQKLENVNFDYEMEILGE